MLTIVVIGLIIQTQSSCNETSTLDVIFILDSSGSVYDDGYNNWQSELDVVKHIVNNSLPIDSRVGLINFSGCGTSFNMQSCLEQGRLKTEFTLNQYGDPNDLAAVYNKVASMGPDDFNGGYTWTNEALNISLNMFADYSTTSDYKTIVLITDGEPYPEVTHDPCRTSDGYKSDTLFALREMGVHIVTVGITSDEYISPAHFDEYMQCLGLICSAESVIKHWPEYNLTLHPCADVIDVAYFAQLTNITGDVANYMCYGDPLTHSPTTSYPTLHPITTTPTTPLPTEYPTVSPSLYPTKSPTKLPTDIPTLHPITTSPTTDIPTENPVTVNLPTKSPTKVPTDIPTLRPITTSPTKYPTESPSLYPTTDIPTENPVTVNLPTKLPTDIPTLHPITTTPTKYPTVFPSNLPTKLPTNLPTKLPSEWTNDSDEDCDDDESLDRDDCDEADDAPNECSILIQSSFDVCFADPYKNKRSQLWNDIKQCLCKNIFVDTQFDGKQKKCYIEKYHYGNLVNVFDGNGEYDCDLQETFEIETGIFDKDCEYLEGIYNWFLDQSFWLLQSKLDECSLLYSKTDEYPNGYGAIVSGYINVALRDGNARIIESVNTNKSSLFCISVSIMVGSILVIFNV